MVFVLFVLFVVFVVFVVKNPGLLRGLCLRRFGDEEFEGRLAETDNIPRVEEVLFLWRQMFVIDGYSIPGVLVDQNEMLA